MYSFSLILSNEKFDSRSELESDEDDGSAPKHYNHHHRVWDCGMDSESSIYHNMKSIRRQKKELLVIHSVNDPFRETLDYRAYFWSISRSVAMMNSQKALQNGTSVYRYKLSRKSSICSIPSRLSGSFSPLSLHVIRAEYTNELPYGSYTFSWSSPPLQHSIPALLHDLCRRRPRMTSLTTGRWHDAFFAPIEQVAYGIR